jgi:thioesterase domain-containing protein
MKLAEMMFWLEERYGVQVPYDLFFNEPTISFLVHLIDSKNRKPVRRYLVPISESGHKAPLFCLHTASDEPVIYHNLARAMGGNRPIYGFRYLDEGFEHPLIFEAMAKRYVEELTSNFSGPYHLCGTCYGGALAYEMARQLKAGGHEVGLVAMFDAMKRGGRSPRHSFKYLFLRNFREMGEVGLFSYLGIIQYKVRTAIKVVSNKKRYSDYAKRCKQGRFYGYSDTEKETPLQYALDHYYPKTYDGDMLYFPTLRHQRENTGHYEYWSGLANEVESIPLDCEHHEINREKAAAFLARVLSDHMDHLEQKRSAERER